MSTIFLLTTKLYNGTIVMDTINEAFVSKSMAENALNALRELDAASGDNNLKRELKEIACYQDSDDLDILKYKK